MLPILPESPRWLISQGELEEGSKVIARIYGKTTEDPAIQTEVDGILRSLIHERDAGRATWRELFTQGRYKTFQRMLLGLGPLLMSQWSGINTLSYNPILQD